MKYRHWIIIPAIAIVVFEKMTGMSWLQPAGNAAILLWCAYSLHALNKLEWLGNYSYGMYLYHCPILMVMMSHMASRALSVIKVHMERLSILSITNQCVG